jgi:hypothetical protein
MSIHLLLDKQPRVSAGRERVREHGIRATVLLHWLHPRILDCAGASAISGFFAAACSLPFDYVKTQIQKQQPGPDGKLPFAGSLDCAIKTVRQYGPLKLYSGFPTYVVRIAPHVMVSGALLSFNVSETAEKDIILDGRRGLSTASITACRYQYRGSNKRSWHTCNACSICIISCVRKVTTQGGSLSCPAKSAEQCALGVLIISLAVQRSHTVGSSHTLCICSMQFTWIFLNQLQKTQKELGL